jgi:hypothetical protein
MPDTLDDEHPARAVERARDVRRVVEPVRDLDERELRCARHLSARPRDCGFGRRRALRQQRGAKPEAQRGRHTNRHSSSMLIVRWPFPEAAKSCHSGALEHRQRIGDNTEQT